MNTNQTLTHQYHQRRTIRLQGYDYSQEGLYFITICCNRRGNNMRFPFCNIENGEMKLNQFGQIAFDEWMKTPELRPNVELGECIIMPDHMHGIIRILRRGELHSPNNGGILNTPNNGDILHSSNNGDILNTPNNGGILNTPNNGGILNSTNNDGILHSPNNGDILNTPNNGGILNSPENAYKLDSINTFDKCDMHGDIGVYYMHGDRCRGVCDMHGDRCSRGVCNTPLRSPSQTIGAMVRGYKSSVSKQLQLMGFNNKLWQRNYYEHIIRDEHSYQYISNYILNNPAKWWNDRFCH